MQKGDESIAPWRGSLQTGGWPFWVARLVAAIVGLIFLSASLMKATDMALFVRQIKAYGIINQDFVALFTAWGLVAAECALGTALLVFHRPRLVLSFTVALLFFFLGITGWASLTGVTDDCGCFGQWMKHTPGQEAVENSILLVAAILSLMALRHSRLRQTRVRTWACYAGCLVGLALPAVFGFPVSGMSRPEKKLLEVGLGPGDIQGLEYVDLNYGTHLVVLMGADCLHCQESVPALNQLAESPEMPQTIALCMNKEADCVMFVEEFQPVFPIGGINQDIFWRLLGDGDLPRLLLVRDGVVQQIWDQTIPDKRAILEVYPIS